MNIGQPAYIHLPIQPRQVLQIRLELEQMRKNHWHWQTQFLRSHIPPYLAQLQQIDPILQNLTHVLSSQHQRLTELLISEPPALMQLQLTDKLYSKVRGLVEDAWRDLAGRLTGLAGLAGHFRGSVIELACYYKDNQERIRGVANRKQQLLKQMETLLQQYSYIQKPNRHKLYQQNHTLYQVRSENKSGNLPSPLTQPSKQTLTKFIRHKLNLVRTELNELELKEELLHKQESQVVGQCLDKVGRTIEDIFQYSWPKFEQPEGSNEGVPNQPLRERDIINQNNMSPDGFLMQKTKQKNKQYYGNTYSNLGNQKDLKPPMNLSPNPNINVVPLYMINNMEDTQNNNENRPNFFKNPHYSHHFKFCQKSQRSMKDSEYSSIRQNRDDNNGSINMDANIRNIIQQAQQKCKNNSLSSSQQAPNFPSPSPTYTPINKIQKSLNNSKHEHNQSNARQPSPNKLRVNRILQAAIFAESKEEVVGCGDCGEQSARHRDFVEGTVNFGGRQYSNKQASHQGRDKGQLVFQPNNRIESAQIKKQPSVVSYHSSRKSPREY